MSISFDGTPTDIGIGSVDTLTGSGGTYRVGEAAVFVSGNMVAAINDDGVVFAATEYADGSGLGLGSVRPMHVHDNGDGTFELYYQIYDADPLPASYSNWRVTIDAGTGAATAAATEITSGAFATNDTSMLRYAASLPDGNIFIVYPETIGGAAIVDPDGTVVHALANFGGIGTTTSGMHPVDVTVSGSHIFYTWVDSDFGEHGATLLQIYDLDGTEVLAPTEVSEAHTSDFGRPPAVQAETLTDGRVVIAWVDSGTQPEDTDQTSVWFKIYNADGTLAVDATLVNSDIQTGRQDNPLLIATETGFVIGVSVLTFSPPAYNEGRLYEFDLTGALQSITEGAYNWGTANAVRSDNNTAFILDGAARELILDGADGAISTGPVSTEPTPGNDSLTGTDGNDTLDGMGGNDFISDLGGDDLVLGGEGDDTLFASTGADTFNGGPGNDLLIRDATGQTGAPISFPINLATGFIGDPTHPLADTLIDIENVTYRGRDHVQLTGDASNNVLISDVGNDSLDGGAGDDTLLGGAGNDTITDGTGYDSMDGGDGIDLFTRDYLGSFSFVPVIDLALGRIYAQSEPDSFEPFLNFENTQTRGAHHHVVIGNAANNSLETGVGDDTLSGGAGDDTLIGAAGDDSLDGGAGSDTAVFGLAYGDATVSVNADGSGQVVSAEGTDSFARIEFLQFTDQTVALSSLIPGQTIAGSPVGDTLVGGGGNDTLSGAAGNDAMAGGGGSDNLTGGIGFDSIGGGAGDDTLAGNDGYDSLLGEAGDDSLTGNNGFDTLSGGDGNDTLSGGLGIDSLLGDAGNDLISGNAGADVLEGGADDDTLNGNAGADLLDGGDGVDLLNGGINNDTLEGGAGTDTLNGGNGADLLTGGSEADRLEGNAGADTLNGGLDDDVLPGGIGADTFVFEVGSGNDRIVDFQNNIDSIHIDADLLTEATPVADDLRNYASLNSDGFLVLTFGSDSLTFTGVTNTGAILDEVVFI